MNPQLVSIFLEFGISVESLAARGLCEHDEAQRLELAETGSDGRTHLLVADAAAAWRGMKTAAAHEGIRLDIVSAFRSIERQADIIRRKRAAGFGIEDVLAVCAPPGYSEHHSGRAVDIATPGSPPLDTAFEATPAFAWLEENAGAFGFHLSYPPGNRLGYQYEPWHWCFGSRGTPA